MNRRTFLSTIGLFPFLSFERALGHKIKKDSNKIVDLNPHLSYNILSRKGNKMSDGYLVPGLPDGMGAFAVKNKTVIIRNHELTKWTHSRESAFSNPKKEIQALDNKHYDVKSFGGTTTMVYDNASNKVVNEYLSLSGTIANCGGGITPWGTWLSCEEHIEKKQNNQTPHGYVFEVSPLGDSLEIPRPLKKMGRFNHEAVAFDKFNQAYLTEDRNDGLIYKFIPERINSLKKGELFALRIDDNTFTDFRNWSKSLVTKNKRFNIEWIKIEEHDPIEDSVRFEGHYKGATKFARGEGITSDGVSIYIACTNGGPVKKGQIWKITPTSKNESTIELWYEVDIENNINMPDNIMIAPWGDLIVCEDNSDINRLWGINPNGQSYLIAENNYNGAEFAGVCFSPIDGSMFVNLQQNGLTISVTGNWKEVLI